MVVVPEINAGTASLAYAVINPAIGLGTFLAQVLPAQAADRQAEHARVPRHRAVGRSEGRAGRAQHVRRRRPRARPRARRRPRSRRSDDDTLGRGATMKIAALQMVSTTERRAQPRRRARALVGAGRRARAPRWSRCPSTSASWADATATSSRSPKRPATGRSRRCSPRRRASTGVWLVGGTLPLAARRRRPRAINAQPASSRRTASAAARYDKIHLFRYDNGREQLRRRRARSRPAASRSRSTPARLRVGLSVCYDLRFPELYRALMKPPCDLLCVPSAFTYTDRPGALGSAAARPRDREPVLRRRRRRRAARTRTAGAPRATA